MWPSIRGQQFPLTAYIAGYQVQGHGETVVDAIEDLLMDGRMGRVCQQLEREIQHAKQEQS